MPANLASCFPLPTQDSAAGLPHADNLSLLGLGISKTQPDLSSADWLPSNFTATVQITNALTSSDFSQFRFIAYPTDSPTRSPRVHLATYNKVLIPAPNAKNQYIFQLYWPDDILDNTDPKNSVAQLAAALTNNNLTIVVQYCLVAAQNIAVDDTANPNCSDPTGLEMHEIDSNWDASLKGKQAVVVTWQPYNGLGNPPYDSYLVDPPNAPPVNFTINVIPLAESSLVTDSVVFSYTVTTSRRPMETKISKATCLPLNNASVANTMQCAYSWTPNNVKFPKDSINTHSVILIADMMIKNTSATPVPHSERTTVNTHGSK